MNKQVEKMPSKGTFVDVSGAASNFLPSFPYLQTDGSKRTALTSLCYNMLKLEAAANEYLTCFEMMPASSLWQWGGGGEECLL